jgi:hypothetical protein
MPRARGCQGLGRNCPDSVNSLHIRQRGSKGVGFGSSAFFGHGRAHPQLVVNRHPEFLLSS